MLDLGFALKSLIAWPVCFVALGARLGVILLRVRAVAAVAALLGLMVRQWPMLAVGALGAAIAKGEPASAGLLLDSLVVECDLLAMETDDDLDLDVEDPASLVLGRAQILPATAVQRVVGQAAAQATVRIGVAVSAVQVERGRGIRRRRLSLDPDYDVLVVGVRDVEVEDERIAPEVELDLAVDVLVVAVGVVLAEAPVLLTLVVGMGQEEGLGVRHIGSGRSVLARVEGITLPALDALGRVEPGYGLDLQFSRDAGDATREGSQNGGTHGEPWRDLMTRGGTTVSKE